MLVFRKHLGGCACTDKEGAKGPAAWTGLVLSGLGLTRMARIFVARCFTLVSDRVTTVCKDLQFEVFSPVHVVNMP